MIYHHWGRDRDTETRPNGPGPQPPHCQAPRQGQNHLAGKGLLLLARDEQLDRQLCQGVCDLSAE